MNEAGTDVNFLELDLLRAQGGYKWRKVRPAGLATWVADMDMTLPSVVGETIEKTIRLHDLGYPDFDGLDPSCVSAAGWYERQFSFRPDPGCMVALSDVMQGIYFCLKTMCRPGRRVVIQPPIYSPFFEACDDAEMPMLRCPLMRENGGYAVDWPKLEGVFEEHDDIDAFLLCNPQNPTGMVWSRPDLERLAALCLKHGVLVLSDEIWADLIYDGKKHVPFASLGAEVAENSVSFFSTSKSFGVPGLRHAVAMFGSHTRRHQFNTMSWHYRSFPNVLGSRVAVALWEEGEPWLAQCRLKLQEARDDALNLAQAWLGPDAVHCPEASYLLWLRAKPSWGRPFAEYIKKRTGVLVSEGKVFGDPNYIRMNFATSASIRTQIFKALSEV